MKRSFEGSNGDPHSFKKHKDNHPHHHKHHHKHRNPDGHSKQQHGSSSNYSHAQNHYSSNNHETNKHESPRAPTKYEDALSQLPPPTSTSASVPAYTHFTVSSDLPELPSIKDGPLTSAPFKHKSTVSYNRTSSSTDITYERLEFIGDAYIELIASRLIFERFVQLPAGQQSQLRELLVKNETLAEYSRAYGFDKRVNAAAMEQMLEDGKHKGNKGFNKVLGDVFEAYLAAVVLSDMDDGFAVAEKWLTALWAPKLVESMMKNQRHTSKSGSSVTHTDSTNPLTIYNPTAKQDLQKRILGSDTKLLYDKYKDTVELKGDQLGQNKHFIALYLTGYGYEKKLLGKGEGKNKVEAGNWAANEAMFGECKGIVDQCEKKLLAAKDEKRLQKEAKEAEKKSAGGKGGHAVENGDEK